MLVGRESEISQLEAVLREGQSALVVVSSKPGMGRSALIEELRRRAGDQNWRILPAAAEAETAPGTIAIDRNTTEGAFRDQIAAAPPIGIQADVPRIKAASPRPGPAVPEGAMDDGATKADSVVSVQGAAVVIDPQAIREDAVKTRADALAPPEKPGPRTGAQPVPGGTLLLIDSYQPDHRFEAWFLRQYLPETKRATPPVVVVVAGYSGDLAALSASADRTIELGPLPVQATQDYFRSLNHQIDNQMAEEEIKAYAEASAGDPSLIGALTRLLQLK